MKIVKTAVTIKWHTRSTKVFTKKSLNLSFQTLPFEILLIYLAHGESGRGHDWYLTHNFNIPKLFIKLAEQPTLPVISPINSLKSFAHQRRRRRRKEKKKEGKKSWEVKM